MEGSASPPPDGALIALKRVVEDPLIFSECSLIITFDTWGGGGGNQMLGSSPFSKCRM